MIINEQEARRILAQEVELEVPAGVDPSEFFASQFGELTPHDEIPEPDVNDETFIIRLK